MEKINPEDLLKLWKKGKTLDASLFEYTDDSLRKKLDNSYIEFQNLTNAISEEYPHGVQSMADGLKGAQKIITKHQDFRSANNELKWNLLNNVLSEKLIGLGFESPIKTSSTPQVIPIYIWPQKIFDINWSESSFLNNGVEFLNIRLIEIAELKNKKNIDNQINKLKKLPDIKIKDKKVGRPSKKEKIIEAYEYLKKNNKLKYSKTLKSHTELIQQTVHKLNPKVTGTKGMQHEAIRRTLSERFQADKDNL